MLEWICWNKQLFTFFFVVLSKFRSVVIYSSLNDIMVVTSGIRAIGLKSEPKGLKLQVQIASA